MAVPRLNKGSIEHRLEGWYGKREVGEAVRGYAELKIWSSGNKSSTCSVTLHNDAEIRLGTQQTPQPVLSFVNEQLEKINAYMDHIEIQKKNPTTWSIVGDLYVFGKLPDKK